MGACCSGNKSLRAQSEETIIFPSPMIDPEEISSKIFDPNFGKKTDTKEDDTGKASLLDTKPPDPKADVEQSDSSVDQDMIQHLLDEIDISDLEE